ncbi:MAG: hypothetical protein AB1801_19680, partial [Chloroflexota bacterium]
QAVAALAKPNGGLEPYGYQIIFKAAADPHLAPGIYTSQLSSRDRDGQTAATAAAAPVELYAPGAIQSTYLPLMLAPPRRDGPWYLSQPAAPAPGAIVPDEFLRSAPAGLAALATVTPTAVISLSARPQLMSLVDAAGLGAVLLVDGRLEILELTGQQSIGVILVGDRPQTLTADAPQAGQVYVGLENVIVLIDLQAGQVIARWPEPGRWRGLARDAAAGRLFAADAAGERLLVLREDLSQQLAAVPLPEQPDRLIFDPSSRQLYVSFPAAPQILAIDAGNLNFTAQSSLVGGPILDLALDPSRRRLYVLNALAPGYRGLTELDTPALTPLKLIAGAGDFPLRTASALAAGPSGQLLLPEVTGLWQISPLEVTVHNLRPAVDLSPVSQLVAGPNGRLYALEPAAAQLRIYQ